MILDKMESFALLKHYEIRAVRAKHVDSAEDAIAFAERRNAPDPRFLPIVLHANEPEAEPSIPAAGEHPLKTEEAIRHAYAELVHRVGAGERRIWAHEAVEPGSEIAISGRTDEAKGKVVSLQSATHSVERMLPINAAAAEALAENFEGYHHRGSREQTRRMIEYLLERVSELFEQTPITAFRLTMRLHENSYTVLDASMTSPKAVHLRPRLDPRAHDRKGDDFHPAGRQ